MMTEGRDDSEVDGIIEVRDDVEGGHYRRE